MSRTTENKGLTPPKAGDILLYPDDEIIDPHREGHPDLFHAVIFDKDRILHSTTSGSGKANSGIKDHHFSFAEMPIPLLALRCNDSDIANGLAQVAEVFALKPEERKARDLPRYPTLYASPGDRTMKQREHEQAFPRAYAYLRAIRTQAKAARGDKQSLSRNKGVACSQFVLYSLQASAYEKLADTVSTSLPGELNDFLTHCQAIITARLDRGDGTKLNEIFASHTAAIEHLDHALTRLEAEHPSLELFRLNPKGVNIDKLYQALTPQSSVSPCIYIPVREADGQIQAEMLSFAQARCIPQDHYMTSAPWPIDRAELTARLETFEASASMTPANLSHT
jgi:hypothetical protein